MLKSFIEELKKTTLILGVFLPVLGFAQQSVSVTITDADTGEPLLGVTVLVQGTNRGTVSDFEGNYLIQNLDAGDYVLEVSYTGYSRLIQDINVGISDVVQDLQLNF